MTLTRTDRIGVCRPVADRGGGRGCRQTDHLRRPARRAGGRGLTRRKDDERGPVAVRDGQGTRGSSGGNPARGAGRATSSPRSCAEPARQRRRLRRERHLDIVPLPAKDVDGLVTQAVGRAQANVAGRGTLEHGSRDPEEAWRAGERQRLRQRLRRPVRRDQGRGWGGHAGSAEILMSMVESR